MAPTSDSPQRFKFQVWLGLSSYEGWAVARMLTKGWKTHDLCRTIVREWLVSKREELQQEYGVSRQAWEQEKGGNVRSISKERKSGPIGKDKG